MPAAVITRAVDVDDPRISLHKFIDVFGLESQDSSSMNAEQGYAMFEKLLLKHSIERPPWSVAVFNFQDVKAVSNYIRST